MKGFHMAVAAVMILGAWEGPAQAAPIDDAVALIQDDSLKLTQWLGDQFRTAVPYNATAANVVPAQLKLFGFEVGVSGAVTGTEVDDEALLNLDTEVLNTAEIETPSHLPFPLILAHAKIGLPWGFD